MRYLQIVTILLLLAMGVHAQQAIFDDAGRNAGLAVAGGSWGATVRDFDGDQHEDLMVTRLSQSNLVHRNLGNGLFQEIGGLSGLSLDGRSGMPLCGDIDNDGDADVFIASLGQPNFLFRNTGSSFFENITLLAGVGDASMAEAAGFFDYDLDGQIDLFVFNRGADNLLYRNLGGGQFAYEPGAGIFGRSNAMGLSLTDFDGDGLQDIYLVYDGRQVNNLYRNNGDGSFTDVAAQAGIALRAEGMAPAFGDYNNDGLLDVYITNLDANNLFQNNGDGTFTDVTDTAGVGDRGMGWGLTWLDYDNDGWLDLYVVNASGYNSPPDPNVLYRNNQDGTFSITNADDPSNSLLSGFAVACADFNRDGFLDLFVTNQGGENQLFMNRTNGNHWLMVRLEGRGSNRDALGARVELRAGGLVQTREVTSSNGWVSQNSLTLHFGLAENTVIDEIRVTWPNAARSVEHISNVTADQQIHIVEGKGLVTRVGTPDRPRTPEGFRLSPAFPNPFGGATGGGHSTTTTITYSIDGASPATVELGVFNTLGQLVKSLVAERQQPSQYSVRWHGNDALGNRVGQGVYFIRLRTGSVVQSQKILLLKQ